MTHTYTGWIIRVTYPKRMDSDHTVAVSVETRWQIQTAETPLCTHFCFSTLRVNGLCQGLEETLSGSIFYPEASINESHSIQDVKSPRSHFEETPITHTQQESLEGKQDKNCALCLLSHFLLSRFF